MEKFAIPPSPNWYESDVMDCASDNTIMYGSRNNLIVIKPGGSNLPNNVQVIPDAHFKTITIVKFKGRWGFPKKYAVTASTDNVIKLWNVATLQRKMSHNKHCSHEGVKVIGVAFAGENRVVSAASEGQVIIWDIVYDEHTILDSIFKTVKGTLTSFSICPHEVSRAAFGMKNGLVLIVDLRGSGKILATYRGHKSEVTSMSWCPVPVNIFPKNPNNRVGEKKIGNAVKGETVVLQSQASEYRNGCKETSETPNVGKPETESKTKDGENKTDKLKTNAASTDEQESSEQNTTNEKLNAIDELPPLDNWRVEAALPKFEEEPRKEYLLATTARDGYVYIWQTLGGPLATFFTIPFTKYKAKNKTTAKDVFNVLCWVAPHTLLSSANSGELLAWTLPKPGGLSKAYKKVHHHHGKLITSIKAPIVYNLDETNFLQTRNITVWTTGPDRILCNFDCGSNELITYYQSQNGSACCLAGCPLDPSRLAIGDEKNIKIWNLGQTSKKIFNFPTTFEKIHSVITAMVWHPNDEDTLAFGTQEGRIGILTISGSKLKTKVLPQYFKSEIYKMEWGPENKYGLRKLFALSDGVVVRFDFDTEDEPAPIVLPKRGTDEASASVNMLYTFSWCPDYRFFLGSSKDGGCIKFDKDFKSHEFFYLNSRMDSIVWLPDLYLSENYSTERKDFSTVFASVSNGSKVNIYIHLSGEPNIEERFLLFHSFSNKSRIRDLRWSPFFRDLLAWVDAAGVLKVVNFEIGTILHTYINPWLDGLASMYWSPIDSNFIILATDNRMLLSVDITSYGYLRQEAIDSAINKISKKRGNELTHNLPKAKEDKKEKEDGKGKNKKSPLGVNVFYTIKEKNQVSDLRNLLQWKLEGRSPADESVLSCSYQISVLDVFSDDSDFEKIFKLNVSSLTQNNHTDKVNMMALIQGNINETIKNAIEQKRVSMWIISVASMVSPQCWKDACKTYVEQLLEQPEPNVFEVVTFQLVCHQVEEAVKFLCDRKYFREAYVLAKKRLGPAHEISNSVLSQWGKHCSYEGNYELAACCYITLGMFSEAAYLLFRRTDVNMLDFAAHLAQLAGNVGLKNAIKDKVESLQKPVDITGSSPPYLDHKGKTLRIFTPRSPGHSDVSEAENSDNEVVAVPKQELVKSVKAIEKPQEEAKEENTDQPTATVVEDEATEKPQEEAQAKAKEENTDKPTTAVVVEKTTEKPQKEVQTEAKQKNTDQPTTAIVVDKATEKPQEEAQAKPKEENTDKPITAVIVEKATEKPQEKAQAKKENTDQPTIYYTVVVVDKVTEKPQEEAQAKPKQENTDQPTAVVVKDRNQPEGSDHEESYELAESPHSFVILEEEADVSMEFEVVENASGKGTPSSDVVEELEDLKLDDNPIKAK